MKTLLDEEIEAARDDVRLFAIFLDEYHILRGRPTLVTQQTLSTFVADQIGPTILVTLAYPFTSIYDMRFHRDRRRLVEEISKFEGRRGDFTPRRPMEDLHNAARDTQRVRKEVTLSALSALVTHMGGLREGRKAVVFVSEGFSSSDVMGELQALADAANRANVAIYAIDPRGLSRAGYAGSAGGGPGDMEVDTLRVLADQTNGTAFVNHNDLVPALDRVVRDSSLVLPDRIHLDQPGVRRQIPRHQGRVKREGVDIRARKGYKALTKAEHTSLVSPKMVPAASPQAARALESLVDLTGRPIRMWFGTSRAPNGMSRLAFAWEPTGTQPVEVLLHASGMDGTLYFKGPALRSASPGGTTGGAKPNQTHLPATGVIFDALPGRARVSLDINSGNLKQQLNAAIVVPDYSTMPIAIDTPRVFRARTSQELKELMDDPDAIPTAGREFQRSDRVLVRFGAYTFSDADPVLTAKLLTRTGEPLADLPVSLHPRGQPWSELDLPLANLATGDFLLEITATHEDDKVTELVGLRVTR